MLISHEAFDRLEKEAQSPYPQSQEGKLPAFEGPLKTKKSSSGKKEIYMNEPVLHFIPLNFTLSALFANKYNAMIGKVRNKRAPRLGFHHQGIMAAI